MKKKTKIVLLSIISFILILILVIILYFNNYYHSESIVNEYLTTKDQVKVTKESNYYFFDGPGTENALVFYPGAKVEYTAYAPLMYKLSEKGIDTFLVKMPLNFAFFDAKAANRIISQHEYENWYISGHSLGGVVASNLRNDKIKGIVLLASYPNKKIPDNIRVLSIYGELDGVLNLNKYRDSKKYMNKDNTKYVTIIGGNHANYAYYGKQKGDLDARITTEEQIDTTIELIMDFIR